MKQASYLRPRNWRGTVALIVALAVSAFHSPANLLAQAPAGSGLSSLGDPSKIAAAAGDLELINRFKTTPGVAGKSFGIDTAIKSQFLGVGAPLQATLASMPTRTAKLKLLLGLFYQLNTRARELNLTLAAVPLDQKTKALQELHDLMNQGVTVNGNKLPGLDDHLKGTEGPDMKKLLDAINAIIDQRLQAAIQARTYEGSSLDDRAQVYHEIGSAIYAILEAEIRTNLEIQGVYESGALPTGSGTTTFGSGSSKRKSKRCILELLF